MNIFNSVSATLPKRNKFNLSHEVKLTGEMGQLIPFLCERVIPNDRWRVSSSQLVRFAPMLAPLMSQVDVYTHYYYVPNRIIWKKFEDFITASKNGKRLADIDIPLEPRIEFQTLGMDGSDGNGYYPFMPGSLFDYLGLPTLDNAAVSRQGGTFSMPELPFRAYQRIWFDWFRDENLSDWDDWTIIDNDDFNDGTYKENDQIYQFEDRTKLLLKLQRRAWRKDYFTSALPFAQKGDEVLIPGIGDLTINSNGNTPVSSIPKDYLGTFQSSSGVAIDSQNVNATHAQGDTNTILRAAGQTFSPKFDQFSTTISSEAIANALSVGGSVSEGTIRELRRAFAAQKFLEREAVAGSRYCELLQGFFGVKPQDSRLQRSEFLGGSKQPVVVSQVLQTSESTQNSPLGQPAGNAVSGSSSYIFDRTFPEHGWIIGLISVVPKAEYMRGMPKKYLLNDRWDYYWPQFARIGEQPIQKQELQYDFLQSTFSDPDSPTPSRNTETFGYTPRYSEYRFINSHIHGDFKTNLNFWTLARDYDEGLVPVLNESFIECKPSDRIWAYDPEEDENKYQHLWMSIGLRIDALRPLPKYAESL